MAPNNKSTKSQPAVILALNTANEKLKGCAVTYVSQDSCPKDCRFLGTGNGCYAQYGPMMWGVTGRLNQATQGRGIRPSILARMEKRKILGGLGDPRAIGMPLRLHGVGDCRTNRAAAEVSGAAEVWRRTTGAPVWGYTHAWRTVIRAYWRRVSILASVENPQDLPYARRLGYAAALVVSWFPYGPKAYTQWVKEPGMPSEKYKIVPCPEQSMPGRGIGCKDCGLCWKDKWLRENRVVIGFAAHGPGAKTVREKLIQIGEDRPGEGKLWG
jgi:hypothetical protein